MTAGVIRLVNVNFENLNLLAIKNRFHITSFEGPNKYISRLYISIVILILLFVLGSMVSDASSKNDIDPNIEFHPESLVIDHVPSKFNDTIFISTSVFFNTTNETLISVHLTLNFDSPFQFTWNTSPKSITMIQNDTDYVVGLYLSVPPRILNETYNIEVSGIAHLHYVYENRSHIVTSYRSLGTVQVNMMRVQRIILDNIYQYSPSNSNVEIILLSVTNDGNNKENVFIAIQEDIDSIVSKTSIVDQYGSIVSNSSPLIIAPGDTTYVIIRTFINNNLDTGFYFISLGVFNTTNSAVLALIDINIQVETHKISSSQMIVYLILSVLIICNGIFIIKHVYRKWGLVHEQNNNKENG